MLGIFSLVLLTHCIYSCLRWRKFLQGNSQQVESLPIDIITQALIGIVFACISIASNAKKLKKINSFDHSLSYDKALERKNFRDYGGDRGFILQEIVKKKLKIQQFVAPA